MDAPEQLLEEAIQLISSSKENEKEFKKSRNVDDLATKKVVNKSIEPDIPPVVLALLKEMYHDMILDLANQYGGYFNKW